jgi:hypothetical protein
MNVRKTACLALALLLLPLQWSSPLQAGSKCDKKKTECKDGSGKVTDCCSSSQTCKNGKCFYPGELQMLESKNPKTQPVSGQGGSGSKDASGDKTDNAERIKLLGKMLLESDDFKVRIQAAFSLSKIEDPKILPYLVKALKDKHPAVRSAAATSLGNAGDPGALDALYKIVDNDPNSMVNEAVKEAILKIETDPTKLNEMNKVPETICSVPVSKVKYLFVIGNMDDKAEAKRPDLGTIFKRHLSNQLKGINNSMIVTGSSVPKDVLGQIEKGKAYGFLFSASLKQLDGEWDGTSGYVMTAKVSIICSKYPAQILAMTMNSTASSTITKSGFRKKLIPKMQEDAIKGAIDSMAQSIKENLSRLTEEEGPGPKPGKGSGSDKGSGKKKKKK